MVNMMVPRKVADETALVVAAHICGRRPCQTRAATSLVSEVRCGEFRGFKSARDAQRARERV
jgi:hypothetical protein